jgi:adhesin HecA-like repeat protein
MEADCAFGTNTTMTIGSKFDPDDIESNAKLTIAEGATLDNDGKIINYGIIDIYGTMTNLDDDHIENHGIINIYGTVTNLGDIENYGTINNYSANTLDNRGTMTNKGTINNASTGKITNTGKIDNTDGTINNEGTIKSDAANITGNLVVGKAVEPINSDSSADSSSGGGCNAGFSLFGLLFAGLVIRKSQKA